MIENINLFSSFNFFSFFKLLLIIFFIYINNYGFIFSLAELLAKRVSPSFEVWYLSGCWAEECWDMTIFDLEANCRLIIITTRLVIIIIDYYYITQLLVDWTDYKLRATNYWLIFFQSCSEKVACIIMTDHYFNDRLLTTY